MLSLIHAAGQARRMFARVMAAAVLSLAAALALPHGAHAVTAIKEEAFVPIGGIEQWITIKGNDRTNPVVLVLHGGPGNAWSPFADAMFAGWENDVTLVQWDQRGAGRTFGKGGASLEATMTVERMAQDGIEVAEFLTRRLGKKKIVVMGGSWGSILGIRMVRARPALFHAYVGTAQMVNWRANMTASYARVLELARDAGDQPSVTALTTLGPPPWDTLRKWPTFRKILRTYQAKIATAPPAPQTLSPGYDTQQERAQYEEADEFSFVHFVGMTMSGPLTAVDLPALGLEFSVPVVFVHGQEDLTALPGVARTYFDSIKAPRKQFHLVPGSGHEPSAASLALVRKLLVEDVRPWTGER